MFQYKIGPMEIGPLKSTIEKINRWHFSCLLTDGLHSEIYCLVRTEGSLNSFIYNLAMNFIYAVILIH